MFVSNPNELLPEVGKEAIFVTCTRKGPPDEPQNKGGIRATLSLIKRRGFLQKTAVSPICHGGGEGLYKDCHGFASGKWQHTRCPLAKHYSKGPNQGEGEIPFDKRCR